MVEASAPVQLPGRVDTVHDLDQARNEIYPKLRHFWEAEPRTAAGLRRAG
jgi:hypothetical protein